MLCTTELRYILYMRYINHLSNMCILNTLRGDSKLEMGDGKCPLDIRGGGGQKPEC